MTSLYSETRTTRDIDFVTDIFSVNRNIENYTELLNQHDFFPFQDWNTTIALSRDTKLIQYLDRQQRIKFDNYIIDRKSLSKYKRIGPIALKRRVRINFLRINCWATSKEDYVLSKLVFGGWQDYTDALGCWMRFSETLDVPYLEKTGKDLGIKRELDLLMSGIDDPDE